MSSEPARAELRLQAEAGTDVGRVRQHNEDHYLLVPEYNLFLLADGMGGHNAGEVASRVALEAARDFFVRTIQQKDSTWPYPLRDDLSLEANRLVAALRAANTRVLEESKTSKERSGMGTTVVGLYVADHTAYIAHMGDSRAYRMRKGRFEQLTEDHSLVQEQLRAGILTEAEAAASPYKNVITRACGIREGVIPDIHLEPAEAGDIYLLCSDGLSNLVSDERMAEILRACGDDLAGAIESLIGDANRGGGDDNITVLLVSFAAA